MEIYDHDESKIELPSTALNPQINITSDRMIQSQTNLSKNEIDSETDSLF